MQPRNWQMLLAQLGAVSVTIPAHTDGRGVRISEPRELSLAGRVAPVLFRYSGKADRLVKPFCVFRMIGADAAAEPPLRGPGRNDETFEVVVYAADYEGLDSLWREAVRVVGFLPGASAPVGGTDSTLEDAPTTIYMRTFLVTLPA